MHPFLDSAHLDDVSIALRGGWLRGITTNPSLMAKEPKADYLKHLQELADLCTAAGQVVPLSVEVFARDPRHMLEQARGFVQRLKYGHLVVKIPISWETLEVIRELAHDGIKVNVTCGFTEAQGVLAAAAGGTYYSLFYHRIKDAGADAALIVRQTRQLLAGTGTQIICGSIRSVEDIMECAIAGADIVTAGLQHWQAAAHHPKSVEWNEKFLSDFAAWLS